MVLGKLGRGGSMSQEDAVGQDKVTWKSEDNEQEIKTKAHKERTLGGVWYSLGGDV